MIEADCRDTYEKLADEYKQELFEAQQAAAALVDEGDVETCYFCGGQKTMIDRSGSVECFLCRNTADKHACVQCDEWFPDDFMRVWNDDGPGPTDWICDGCHDHLYERAMS